MDPRARADAALARARARGIHVVTPDNMTSPMDSSATQQIPRSMVDAADPRTADPDSTMVLSAQVAAGRPPEPAPAPQPELRVAPGPVPTVHHVETSRPSLSQRLSGGQDQRPPGVAQRLNGEG
ncbi:hypothetical protein [Saccharothrix algeriensis]|uniref:ABC-type polar amino acid transport system ATPase subunit n=1 Tax=Saccharothrix algeriensis TaxID=173560 RepID=A0ABS2SAH9_9PSEU|nr:hypothetical protein [Saccharothrix algeriensis]MBM7812959.1 ABC-type polar amino acid transport system ATPase subunit [Saccharothrix algeriensis]